MAILAEPFYPSWLLIHHFRSPLRATGLLPLSDFLPHTRLFNCPDTFPVNPAVGSLPTFPLAMSDTPQKTFVLQQWEIVPSSVHSKEKLTPVTSANRHRTGKFCEADKADTKHFFAEVLLTANVSKVLCVLHKSIGLLMFKQCSVLFPF